MKGNATLGQVAKRALAIHGGAHPALELTAELAEAIAVGEREDGGGDTQGSYRGAPARLILAALAGELGMSRSSDDRDVSTCQALVASEEPQDA